MKNLQSAENMQHIAFFIFGTGWQIWEKACLFCFSGWFQTAWLGLLQKAGKTEETAEQLQKLFLEKWKMLIFFPSICTNIERALIPLSSRSRFWAASPRQRVQTHWVVTAWLADELFASLTLQQMKWPVSVCCTCQNVSGTMPAARQATCFSRSLSGNIEALSYRYHRAKSISNQQHL